MKKYREWPSSLFNGNHFSSYGTYVNEVRALVRLSFEPRASVCMSFEYGCQYACPLKLGREPKRRHDTLTCKRSCCYCYIFLKEFSSNRVSCHFNTTVQKKISSADADWKLRQDLVHDSSTHVHRIR